MKNRERLGPEGLQGWDAIVSVDRLTTPLGSHNGIVLSLSCWSLESS
jgi:hypothetical protein